MEQALKYGNPSRMNSILITGILDWTWETKKYIQTNKYENLIRET